MARFTVTGRYSAVCDGQRFGPWTGGESVELSDAEADWINRDCAGILEPADAVVVADREAEPVADRMVRRGRTRGA